MTFLKSYLINNTDHLNFDQHEL